MSTSSHMTSMIHTDEQTRFHCSHVNYTYSYIQLGSQTFITAPVYYDMPHGHIINGADQVRDTSNG